MSESTFKYADQDDLRRVFNRYGEFTGRSRLQGWTLLVSNKYVIAGVGYLLGSSNGTGIVFFDGNEGTEESDVADLDDKHEWHYDKATDVLTIYSTTDPDDNTLIEVGEDKETYINQQLVNASQQLDSMLDARFSVPLRKGFPNPAAVITDTPEYDAIIIRATCLICTNNLLLTHQEFDLAEKYMNQVTNVDETGLLDRINAGEYKLNFERTQSSRTGEIVEITKTGTMQLVELMGEFTRSELFEQLQIICTTEGEYGTATVTPKTSSSTELFGMTGAEITVTGGFDYLGCGIYGRFEGYKMSENDRWDIRLWGGRLTNIPIKSVQLRVN